MLDSTSKRISFDKVGLGVQLMTHQKAIVYDAIIKENNNINSENAYAMMSDLPGAGKTYAILAMIYFSNKYLFPQHKHITLIVVPYNICTQWKESMNNMFGGSGKLIDYKVLLEYGDIISLYHEPESLNKYDIILTTSLYFSNLAGTLNSLKIKVRRVFFDEADTIKNLLYIPLNCSMTWFVSASMESLFGKSSNVTIGNYNLSMNHLKANDVKCNPDFIHQSIKLNDPIIYNININNIFLNILLNVTSSLVHERLHAMDYSVLRSQYVNIDITKIETEYDALQYVISDIENQLEIHPKTIEELEKDYKALILRLRPQQAEQVKENIKELESIILQLKNKYNTIEQYKLRYDFDKEAHLSDIKFRKLQDLILDIHINNKKQTILFTNHAQIYNTLKPFLHQHNILFRELDGGNINSMDSIITSYKNKSFDILLADSSMYSCGMNLENTDNIIFIHKMDENKEKQVIGRAHRYGRKGSLNVYYLQYYIS